MAIHLISNVHRSGSSMMMRCLTEAGMTGYYDTILDNQLFLLDYHPNPNGFYQSSWVNENSIAELDGKVLKFPFRKLTLLPVGDYKILILKRNPIEIEKSMQSWTPFKSWGKESLVLEFYDLIVNSVISQISGRTDINLTILNYPDIVNNSTVELNKLIDNGWVFDVSIASSLVTDSLYRFKLENI